MYLTSTNQTAIIAAEAKISANCLLPNIGTEKWDDVKKAVGQNLWFIAKPSIDGWNNFSQEQMMQDVDLSNINEQEYDKSWFPEEHFI